MMARPPAPRKRPRPVPRGVKVAIMLEKAGPPRAAHRADFAHGEPPAPLESRAILTLIGRDTGPLRAPASVPGRVRVSLTRARRPL
jgi:hypothetical protein